MTFAMRFYTPNFIQRNMTEAEFEARADAIAAGKTGHEAHRAFDLLNNELLMSLGGGYARGCRKWLAAIEGDHADGRAYPLPGNDFARWDAEDIARARSWKAEGLPNRIIGKRLGRTAQSVRRKLQDCAA
jgi:hypothetical protein